MHVRLLKFNYMLAILGLCIIFITQCWAEIDNEEVRYFPNWDSIDSRPLPDWYDDGKVGIFLHWGVYSVPGMHSEWFWWYWNGYNEENEVKAFMRNNYSPRFKYADFATDFKATFFDPYHWADVFNKSGANYVVLTSKHHEGFTMYPSNYSWNWNALDIGPNKDIVGLLSKAIREKTSIKFGLYYSLYEWFNPLYIQDASQNFTTKNYIKAVTGPQIKEIVETYLPEVLWLDGDVGPPEYWESLETLAWLYNESPVRKTVVTNDRWGNGCPCHHGGYFTCQDKFIPNQLLKRKWENCMTLDRNSWGFRKNLHLADVLSIEQLLLTLIKTVSFGGNILINVGPTQDGIIVPIFEERLLQLGQWLGVNGEAIYGTKPWTYQKEPYQDIWYTQKKVMTAGHLRPDIFVLFKDWPESDENGNSFLNLTLVNVDQLGIFPNTYLTTRNAPSSANNAKVQIKVSLLGYTYNEELPWHFNNVSKDRHTFSVNLSQVVLQKLASKHSWALKIQTINTTKLDLSLKIVKNNKNIIDDETLPNSVEALSIDYLTL